MTDRTPPPALPFPPRDLRCLVGPLNDHHYDNPGGALVFPFVPAHLYRSVVDFGCGCGRIARQLIQQRSRPSRYLGIDAHAGMVGWAERNLAPSAPGFRFVHHDVGTSFNPGAEKPGVLPLPAATGEASLVIGWSIFTHLVERHAVYYLSEVRRILDEEGAFLSTWFLFDKREFPMLQGHQNALYVNDLDPENAVIFDRHWLLRATCNVGLTLTHVQLPSMRGFQWALLFQPVEAGAAEVELPHDDAPYGTWVAPKLDRPPELIGAEFAGQED